MHTPEKKVSRLTGTGLWWFLLLVAAIHVPFLNKALHIDDFAFITLSGMIHWNPFISAPTDVYFAGRVLQNMVPFESTHPVLIPYFLKIARLLFNDNYIAYHALFSMFTLFSLFGVRELCRVLSNNNGNHIWLIIFFLTTPAYIINAHNLMTDVPALSMALLGMGLYMRWLDRGGWEASIMSAFFLTLSIFTAYQSVLFLFPLAVYAVVSQKRNFPSSLLPLALPLVILAAWLIAIFILYDIFPLLQSKMKSENIAGHIQMGMGWKLWGDKVLFNIAATGLSSFPLIILYMITSKKRIHLILAMVFFSAPVILYVLLFTSLPVSQKILYTIYLTTGCGIIWHFYFTLTSQIRSKQSHYRALFLITWHSLFFLAVTLIFPFAAVRYILPALLPLFLFIYFEISLESHAVFLSKAAWAVLLLSVLLGFVSAKADYDYADSYRSFAEEVKITRQLKKNTFNVWYIGEWGMRYYMNKAGAIYLTATNNDPQAGDLIVIPEMPRLWSPSSILLSRMTGIATRDFHTDMPIRPFSRRAIGGFYCHFWGPLPLGFARVVPVETFQIYRVNR